MSNNWQTKSGNCPSVPRQIEKKKTFGAISREDIDPNLKRGFVCSRHFSSGVSAQSWDKHNIDWVPTLSLGHNKIDLESRFKYSCIQSCDKGNKKKKIN